MHAPTPFTALDSLAHFPLRVLLPHGWQVWHHAPALDVALRAAEAAAKHNALSAEWVRGAECGGRLFAARTQLKQLQVRGLTWLDMT
jgi:hypothetical protein